MKSLGGSRMAAGAGVLLAWLGLLPAAALAGAAARPDAALWNAAGGLRVPFVENLGQLPDEQVRFYARTFGGAVYVLRSGEVVYALPKSGEEGGASEVRAAEVRGRQAEGDRDYQRSAISNQRSAISSQQSAVSGQRSAGLAVLTESFGAGSGPAPVGGRRVAARINSYFGADAARWRTDLPAFETVSLGEIGAGISLELRAHGNSVEKIFTVAPGADPRQIRVALAGAESLAVNARGELEAGTALGVARFSAPRAWQTGAAGRELPVEVAYALEDGAFGFALGAYDPGRPLMIDPLLTATFVGGSGDDRVLGVAVESGTHHIIVAGYTASANFPVTNAWCAGLSGGQDVFVSKFDSSLRDLLFSTYLGGASNDVANAVALDPSGNVLVAGYTESTNFPFTAGAYRTNSAGRRDAFVAQLSASLSLAASTYLGGASNDAVNALAVSADGAAVYVAGETVSTNFPYSGGYTGLYRGAGDGFVARLDSGLATLAYSTFLGGTSTDAVNALALSPATNVYVAGYTYSSNFPTTAGAVRTNYAGRCDAFVALFSPLLTNLAASTFVGGTNQDRAYAVGLDPTGNVYAAGVTYSTNFYPSVPPDAAQTNLAGTNDAFIAALNPGLTAGSATYLGGTSNDEIRALLTVVDLVTTNTTNLVVVGATASSNFPATVNCDDRTYNGGGDAFVAVLPASTNLTGITAATFLGGSSNDVATALAIAPGETVSNYIVTVGYTASRTNFPVSDAAFSTRHNSTNNATSDGFISSRAAIMTYGTKKWEFQAGASGGTNYGGAMFSSPCMGPDGTVFVGANDNLPDGHLLAIRPNGLEKWSFPVRSDDTSPQASPAIGTNGRVYMGDNYEHLIYAVNSTNGTQMSSSKIGATASCPAIDMAGYVYLGVYAGDLGLYRLPSNLASSNVFLSTWEILGASAALGTNNDLYVGATSGKRAYCLNATTGATNGLVIDGDAQFESSPAVDTNGMIFFGASYSNNLYQVNATGAIVRTWGLDGKVSSPVVDSNGFVYVGTSNGTLYKISVAGPTQCVWSGLGSILSAPALGADGTIYVSAGEYLHCLSASGAAASTNWSFLLNANGYKAGASSPLIGFDGTVYVGSGNENKLFAIFGNTIPDVDSPWPRFHHDMLNHGQLGFDHRPPAPAPVAATTNIPDRIVVTWNAVPYATAYEVYQLRDDLPPDPATATRIAVVGQTNYADTMNLSDAFTYNYWIKAKAPWGISVFSAMATGNLGKTPNAPTHLAATKGAGGYTNTILLTWSNALAASPVTNYIVYRHTVNNPGAAQIIANTGTATTYTNTGVSLGVKYFYWVSAVNSYGESEKSVYDYGGTPPLPPAAIAVTKGVATVYLTADWTAATGATAYLVYTNVDDNFSQAGVATNTAGTSFAHSGLTPCRWYYYWVRATNEFGGRGEYTGSDYGWRVLAPPTSVSAGTNGYTNILVAWAVGDTNTAFTTGHRIYRSETDNTNTAVEQASQAYTGTETSYSDQGIVRGKRYYYWIQAYNIYGASAFSAVSAAGSTPPAPPATISASEGVYLDKVRIIWSSAPQATAYHVYRGPNNYNYNQAVLLAVLSGIYYDDTTAVPAENYYYWVRAANAYGVGLFGTNDYGWRGKTPPPPPVPPQPPALVAASDGAFTGYVEIVWSRVSNAVAYEVWRNTDTNSSLAAKLTYDVPGTVYQDASAEAGTVYYYWVKSKTESMTSAFSPSDSGYRLAGGKLAEADIGASDFIILPTVLASGSSPDSVAVRVANYGPQALTAPDSAWVLGEFFISTNAVFGDADDVRFGAFSNRLPLSVRTSSEVILSAADRAALVLPALPLGDYYVFVHIRHCLPSPWWDPVPDNNTALRLGRTIRIGETKAATTVVNDFDGDGRTDLAVYHAPDGNWYIRDVDGRRILYGASWGAPGYQPVAGDFEDSGTSDLAVYSEATGWWFIRTVAGAVLAWYQSWGAPDYRAVPGDYDGDGRSDLAVYSETTGRWYVETLTKDLIAWAEWWGAPDYRAVPGDYDGDGKADFAVYHQADGLWYIRSVAGRTIAWAKWWGGTGYRAVPGDYDGDGISDQAVYHEYGYWFIQTLAGKLIAWADYWGAPGYQPVPGDYDGDGIYDLAVYSEDSGLWYVRTLAGRYLLYGESWGAPGYLPAGFP